MRPVITFHYQRERSDLGYIHRPIADVILVNKRQAIEVAMYIDSGADLTMLPLGAGLALGFRQRPSDRIREIRGVSGGGVPYLIRELILRLDGTTIKARVAWALIEEVPFLLGRQDIFPRFEIIFHEAQRTITFRELPKRKKS